MVVASKRNYFGQCGIPALQSGLRRVRFQALRVCYVAASMPTVVRRKPKDYATSRFAW